MLVDLDSTGIDLGIVAVDSTTNGPLWNVDFRCIVLSLDRV